MTTMTLSKWLARVAMIAAALSSLFATAGTITYYHNDLLGSPIAATNGSGQVIWRETYRPYGERLTNDANSAPNKVWYTSRRQDVESGLVYMGARYYDPSIGRFMSVDPKPFDEVNVFSFNRYSYANDNPFKYRDPDGRIVVLALVPLVEIGLPLLITAAGAWGIYNSTKDTPSLPSLSRPDVSGMSGGGCEPPHCDGAKNDTPTPTDRYKGALDERHLDAARRELDGEVVARRSDGTAYDHVTEVRNAQQGLLNRIQGINNRLSYPGLDAAARRELQAELSEASKLLDHSKQFVPME